MITKREIFEQLKAMGAPRDRIVLMHTSLRSVGEIEGGGKALLDVMIDYFTAEGGLFCVPTHTWKNLGKNCPTLDMNLAWSNLGAFSIIAAEDARGIRSENPTHSMVVFGDRRRAEAFIKDDANIVTPTAPESCYGKLYNEGGFVLLVGVSQTKNTYLHAVAEILNIPDRMSDKPLPYITVKKTHGELVEREWYIYDSSCSQDVSWRFHKYETAFRYNGCIKDGWIGAAPTQLCDAVKMKETIELIFNNCGDVDPLAEEKPMPPEWYCKK